MTKANRSANEIANAPQSENESGAASDDERLINLKIPNICRHAGPCARTCETEFARSQKQRKREVNTRPQFDRWRFPPGAGAFHEDVDLEFVDRQIKKRTGRLRLNAWFRRDDAKDISQEMWLEVWKRIRKFKRSRGPFIPYALRSIDSSVTSMKRKRMSAKSRAEERTKALDERMVRNRRDTDPVESAHRAEVRDAASNIEPKMHDAIRATQAGSVSEAARLAGKARSTIRDQKAKLMAELKRFDPSLSD